MLNKRLIWVNCYYSVTLMYSNSSHLLPLMSIQKPFENLFDSNKLMAVYKSLTTRLLSILLLLMIMVIFNIIIYGSGRIIPQYKVIAAVYTAIIINLYLILHSKESKAHHCDSELRCSKNTYRCVSQAWKLYINWYTIGIPAFDNVRLIIDSPYSHHWQPVSPPESIVCFLH